MKTIRKLDVTQSWEDYSHVGSMVDTRHRYEVTLVTSSGRCPITVGHETQSNYAYEGGSFKKGETVEDALHRLESPQVVRVEVHSHGHDYTSGRDDADWDDVIWYIPDGDEQEQKLELIRQAAHELISKEIGFSEFKRLVRENS